MIDTLELIPWIDALETDALELMPEIARRRPWKHRLVIDMKDQEYGATYFIQRYSPPDLLPGTSGKPGSA